MDSRTRASPEQFLALLDFMESHGDLSRPQSGPQGRIKQDQLWQELIILLNSTGGGVVRSKEKWKKVWADWKTKTKKKALTLHREIPGTGDGQSSRQALIYLEQRVLGVMGLSAVVGLARIEEKGFDDQPSPFRQVQDTAERTPDIISSEIILENLPRHSTQFIEGMTSGSPTVLPPSGGIPSPSAASSPPLVTTRTPVPVPATSPVETTSHSERTASPARHHGRTASPARHHGRTASPAWHRGRTTSPARHRGRTASPARHRGRTASPARHRGRTASEAVAASPTASTSRRRALFARRRRIQTPFERLTSVFLNVENRRLKLEEDREKNLHQRETERLWLESRRLDVEENRNKILADIAKSLTTLLLPSSSSYPFFLF